MHLDEETLAGFAEGRLCDERRASAASHLAGCDECTAIVGAVAQESQGPARSMEIAFDVMRRRPARPWLYTAVAAAAVIALVGLWLATRRATPPAGDPGVSRDPAPEPPTSAVAPPPVPEPQPPEEPTPEPPPTPKGPHLAPPPPPAPPPPEPPPPSTRTPPPVVEPPRRTKSWKPAVVANIHGALRVGGAEPAVACQLRAGDRVTCGDSPVAFQIPGYADVVLSAQSDVELGVDERELLLRVRRGRALIRGRGLVVNDRALDGVLACTAEATIEGDAAEFARMAPRQALLCLATFDVEGEACELVSGARENGVLAGRAARSGTATPAAIWLRPAPTGARLRATVRTASRSVEVTLRTATNRVIRTALPSPKDGRIDLALPDEPIMEVAFTPSVDTKGAKPAIEVDALEILGDRK